MKKKPEMPKTGDPFVDSLHSLAPSDIDCKVPKKKAVAYIGPAVRWGALLLCMAVLIGSLYSIAGSLADYRNADDYYDQLANLWGNSGINPSNPFGPVALAAKNTAKQQTPLFGSVVQNGDSSSNVPEHEEDSATMIQIRAKLNALKTQNSDLLGWITIPTTRIDYPVVHTTDNEYYLNHSFERDFLRAGTIFADYRNSKNLLKNYNTVIYGHNMLAGSMFSCISDFFSRSYFTNNRYIYIYTEEGIFVYKTFAVRKVKINKDASYITTYFPEASDFVTFANKMKNASAIKLNDVEFDENDRIITLSTCTNAHNDNERYCLQAKLVEIRK